MLTIKAEVRKDKLRKDNTFNVKIRLCYERKVIRLSTEIYVYPYELNDDWTFKENTLKKAEIDFLVRRYKDRCGYFLRTHSSVSLVKIVEFLTTDQGDVDLDFITFANEWIASSTLKGKKNYQTALNSFIRFLDTDSLPFSAFTKFVLEDYCAFLQKPDGDKSAGKRSASLYIGSLRHLYREAQSKYNDYDRSIIRIPNDPFRYFKCPKQESTRKRALSIDVIRKIYALPYLDETKANHRRYNLAKDCFIISFCLIGMNSVDLFKVMTIEEKTLVYNRTKTKERRSDEALMKVDILPFVEHLLEKYYSETSQSIFRFSQDYSTPENFNRAINLGLKDVGSDVGVPKLNFYAARHSWATIAVNDAGVDKYTVHSALNHIDVDMKVTDIYIQRNFVAENEANRKVLELVFGST